MSPSNSELVIIVVVVIIVVIMMAMVAMVIVIIIPMIVVVMVIVVMIAMAIDLDRYSVMFPVVRAVIIIVMVVVVVVLILNGLLFVVDSVRLVANVVVVIVATDKSPHCDIRNRECESDRHFPFHIMLPQNIRPQAVLSLSGSGEAESLRDNHIIAIHGHSSRQRSRGQAIREIVRPLSPSLPYPSPRCRNPRRRP